MLLAYLLGYLTHPDDTEIRAGVLTQIERTEKALDVYASSVEDLVSEVKDVMIPAPALIMGYHPTRVTADTPFDFVVQVQNPANRSINNVYVEIDPWSNVEVLSPSSVDIDTLVPNSTTAVNFRLRLRDEHGLLRLSTRIGEELFDTQYVFLSAEKGKVPSPPARPTGGGGTLTGPLIALFLAMVGVAAGVGFVLSRREHTGMGYARARLELVVPGQPPRVIPLRPLPFVIGRSRSCHLVLRSDQVSRLHARIYREGPTFVIEDLGSRNGTFVNEQRIARHVLSPGDTIRIGPFRLRFFA